MLITENHRHVKNSVFQPTPHTTKSSECEIPPVRHLQQIRYTFCSVLWSKRGVRNRSAGGCDAIACLCDLYTEQPGSVAWRGRNSSAEYKRQHRSELLSLVMCPIPQGKSLHGDFFVTLKIHTCKLSSYT